MARLIAGCMTGTSIDGLDVALVGVTGKGLDIKARFVRGASASIDSMAPLLRPVALQKRVTAGHIARYALAIGIHHMIVVKKLAADDTLDLVVAHGQTIYHENHCSLQLINPHPIAQELRVPVVFDLRGGDLAAGGEGAPITPLADHILFRDPARTQAIVNLGGFANFTWLPRTRKTGEAALASIRGGDICVCNQLLDTIARAVLRKKYDEGGARALAGAVDDEAAEMLQMMLASQASGGRSLGTGDEVSNWVKMFRGDLEPGDLARTACAVIARTIVGAVGEANRLVLAGGGVMNEALVREISDNFGGPVLRSDELGVPSQYREAMEMAVLGALAQDGVSITLPQVTGRDKSARVTGCWIYP